MAKETRIQYKVNKLKDTYYEIVNTETGLFSKKIKTDHHWYVNGYFHGLGFYDGYISVQQKEFIEFLNQNNYLDSTFLKRYLTSSVLTILDQLNGLWPGGFINSHKYNQLIGSDTICDYLWLSNFNHPSKISDSPSFKQITIEDVFKRVRKPDNSGMIAYYGVRIQNGTNTNEIIINDCEHGTLIELIRLSFLLNLPKMAHHSFFYFQYYPSLIDDAKNKGLIG